MIFQHRGVSGWDRPTVASCVVEGAKLKLESAKWKVQFMSMTDVRKLRMKEKFNAIHRYAVSFLMETKHTTFSSYIYIEVEYFENERWGNKDFTRQI